MHGLGLALGLSPVTNPTASASGPPLDGLAPTGAWSFSRKLLTSYGGAFYTDAGAGAISAALNQGSLGAAGDFAQGTAANRPVIATAGPNSRAAANFADTTDFLGPAAAIALISATEGYIILSMLWGVALVDNTRVFASTGGEYGIYYNASTGVGTGKYVFWNGAGLYPTAGGAPTIGQPTVLEWKHKAGTLYGRADGGAWQSAVNGDTGTPSSNVQLVTVNGASIGNKVFEFAGFAVCPTDAQIDAVSANFRAWVGA